MDRWRGLQTVRWVLRWGVLQLVVGCWVLVATLVAAASGVPGGGPVLVLVAGGLAAFLVVVGLVLRGFRAQHRWAWWVLVAAHGLQLLAGVRDVEVWSLAAGTLGLVLLVHPDSREWVRQTPPRPGAGVAG